SEDTESIKLGVVFSRARAFTLKKIAIILFIN
ncbi:uncharacterized protein METZ01_LOCUS372332, partial [marine metagenome]